MAGLTKLTKVTTSLVAYRSKIANTISRLLTYKVDEILSVDDFGAVADYSLGMTNGFTDSTEAFRKAAEYSALSGRPVKVVSSGSPSVGYYINGTVNMTPGATIDSPAAPSRAARFIGDGKGKSFIFVNNTDDYPLFTAFTTSGYPTSFGIIGLSIVPINRDSGQNATFLINSGTNMAILHDIFVDRGFKRGIDNVNGKSGTWTELTSMKDVWIRYCTEFDIGFRLNSVGPNGEVDVSPYSDSSFAGHYMHNCELEARGGGKCIYIAPKVHLYNSSWDAVMHTSDSSSFFIVNEGVRHRSYDRLGIEGEGYFTNTGGYDNMSGSWFIQSTSGNIKELNSTRPFVIGNNYISDTTLTDTSFTTGAPAITKVAGLRPNRNSNPNRCFVGLTGNNIESAGYVGYGSGATKTNGFGILSADNGTTLAGLRLRYMLSLSGIYTIDDAWNLDHMSPIQTNGGGQIRITKSGYHHGRRGYRYTSSASASGSAQTVSIQLDELYDQTPFNMSIRLRGTGVDHTTVWLASWGRNGVNGTGTKLATPFNVGPGTGFAVPSNVSISDSGLLTFSITVPVDVSIVILVDGIVHY
ncbi:hypothetical protein [Sphingobacterium alkalisoli]|uniref:hypothetical protein n=2 Tax=Sphingobacteriaceae TaxID=84566 RepID=UPI0016659FA5|nr:hypothetical protein [Sphingobacterium alkalisoli]